MRSENSANFIIGGMNPNRIVDPGQFNNVGVLFPYFRNASSGLLRSVSEPFPAWSPQPVANKNKAMHRTPPLSLWSSYSPSPCEYVLIRWRPDFWRFRFCLITSIHHYKKMAGNEKGLFTMNAIHGHFHIIWYGMLWGMGVDEGFLCSDINTGWKPVTREDGLNTPVGGEPASG